MGQFHISANKDGHNHRRGHSARVAEGPVELMHNDRKGVYPGLSRWRNQGLERKLTVRDSALGSYTAPFFGGRLRWAALSYVGRVQSG